MIRIKVTYDKYHRTLKLLDKELESILLDGGVYELQVPIEVSGRFDDDEGFSTVGVPLAHA